MKSGSRTSRTLVLAAGLLSLPFAVSMSAQVQTTTTTTSGMSTKQVSVEHGEVVMVQGNDLIVKMEDGTIRHFPNIPEGARIFVDGKELGIHDLKPGMKLQRTITTTTTPQTITTVQTVTGKVWYVQPPNSVILTMENGQNQSFKIPKDQKFNVDGNMLDAFALRKGMVVTATKIVEEPVNVTAQQRKVTGTMPSPPSAPPADTPILIAKAAPAEAPATEAAPATAAPTKLPKTASGLPLVGLLGILFVGASFAMKLIRSNIGGL